MVLSSKLPEELNKLKTRFENVSRTLSKERLNSTTESIIMKPLQLSLDSIVEAYSGPHIQEGVPLTDTFVSDMISFFKKTHEDSNLPALPAKYVMQILLASFQQHYGQPSLIRLPLAPTADRRVISVCGDTHGQFYDLLNIFSDNVGGYPSKENPFIFNGDFVDRGRYSLEVILTLLAMKLARPEAIYLTRGNHETATMNTRYGFLGEILNKYKSEDGNLANQIYALFSYVFSALPVAAVIDEKVFVVHGGIGNKTYTMSLEEISNIHRYTEPGYDKNGSADALSELLWSG
jgi:serine/threonine-protein phosphatase 5